MESVNCVVVESSVTRNGEVIKYEADGGRSDARKATLAAAKPEEGPWQIR